MAFVLLGVAAVIGGVGGFLAVRQWRFIQKAECAEGTVQGYSTVHTTDSEGKAASTTFASIAFTTDDGRHGSYQRIVLTRRKERGTKVPLVYDPDDLKRVQVAGSFWQWAPSALVLGLAAIVGSAGIALLV